jgi:ribosomal protein S18 acetylase RimI-like enzyme
MIQLREASNSHLELTFEIKKQSIKPYVEELWGWDEQLQRQLHIKSFNPADISLIDYKGQTIGFTVIKETDEAIFVHNILIMSKFQNLGIGKQLMNDVITKSTSVQKPIRLQVFKINEKALRFYKTSGFEECGETEFHLKMNREVQIQIEKQ